MQKLASKIKDLEASLADSIGANNYAEYDALLSVWNQVGDYQDNNNTHATIASGIKQELFRYGIYFDQDLAQY